MNDKTKNIHKGIGALNTLPDFHYTSVLLPSDEEIMKLFDSYFEKLQSEGLIHTVHYSNDILPELIRRSIYRIKPFTESKQEFRDAII